MLIGIEKIYFYTPKYYINIQDLLRAREIHNEEIDNRKISIPGENEDAVTMSASAGYKCIENIDKNEIKTLIIATESGIDQAKSVAMFVHNLLKLSSSCRVIELKQSCYSSTYGLRIAINEIKSSPEAKVLLICSDIARYKLNSIEETSQGAGAIAMLISADAKVATFSDKAAIYTQDSMDFWRPNKHDEAILNSKLSIKLYINFLTISNI